MGCAKAMVMGGESRNGQLGPALLSGQLFKQDAGRGREGSCLMGKASTRGDSAPELYGS